MKTVQLSKLERETKGLKVFPVFTLLGWGLIVVAGLVVLGLIVSPTGAAYWGGNAKAARDVAAAGSVLLNQLSTLALWKHIVPPLLILAVASLSSPLNSSRRPSPKWSTNFPQPWSPYRPQATEQLTN